jgi:hypothetical protein
MPTVHGRRDAIFFGFTPAAPGTGAFDSAIATAPGGVVKWAVMKGLGLRIMPAETADTIDLYHSVLSGGDLVLAASEAQIVKWAGAMMDGTSPITAGTFSQKRKVLISASTPLGMQESNSMRLDHIERFR